MTNRALAWLGLLLVCCAKAGLGQYSCLPDFGGPVVAESSPWYFDVPHTAQEPEKWRYERIPHTGEIPEGFDWDRVVVEWSAPHRRTADCVDFGGRLLVREPDGTSRPVDWFQGLEVLVAADPDTSPDWSASGPFAHTLRARTLVRPDGSFLVGVHDVDFEERCSLPAGFQVALRLGESSRPFVRWPQELPLLESSVAVLEYSQPAPLTREAFERDWNAKSDGSMLHRGPLDRPWTLLPRPEIELGRAPEHDREAVSAWIDELVTAATPGAGYSATMSGSQFLPVPAIRSMESFVFVDTHGLGIFPPLERLEAAGPAALPALLEHLDDARPTQFEVTSLGCCMWSECRVYGNPLNALERRVLGYHVLEAFGWGRGDPFEGLERYTVTVGDLCFVAIGQITNRDSYRAVQYQPSGNQVVCSMARFRRSYARCEPCGAAVTRARSSSTG